MSWLTDADGFTVVEKGAAPMREHVACSSHVGIASRGRFAVLQPRDDECACIERDVGAVGEHHEPKETGTSDFELGPGALSPRECEVLRRQGSDGRLGAEAENKFGLPELLRLPV